MSPLLQFNGYKESSYCEIHKCKKVENKHKLPKWVCEQCCQDVLTNKKPDFSEQNRIFRKSRLKSLKLTNDLQAKDLANFEILDEQQNHCVNSLKRVSQMIVEGVLKTNVLLVGPTGTGKSHLAIGVLKMLNENWPLSKKLGYTTSSNLAQNIMNTWGTGATESFYEMYANLDFLVIDDFGFNDDGNKVKITQQILFLRHEYGKPTLITSNLLSEECFDLMGGRVASRFFGNLYKSIEVKGLDYRLKDFYVDS
jgi:DNA replication protein DnaC